MELLAPAGNVEKLTYAYAYGADASYIGLKKFSLRVKADNFYEDEYKKVIDLKKQFPGKKLHCALNISFRNSDIDALLKNLDYFKQYPIDAFIVQDLGIVPIIQKEFPDAALHLSTQASCINREAVKMYQKLGFSRVVLGREASIADIKEIKDAVPDMELECFVHGAMCIAYSGRCLLSAYLTGRSAQSGFCSHTCRWDYDVLQSEESIPSGKILTPADSKIIAQSGELLLREHKRPDALFPAFEGDDFTAILSSKDLRMIEHLKELKDAGIDSCKIEGRMKSVYYVAMVTRAYRKAMDLLDGKITEEEAMPFIKSLDEVPHRECTTGFYFSRANADETTVGASDSPYQLAATLGEELDCNKESELFEAAENFDRSRNETMESLHPEAKKARLRDIEMHPEKWPHIVRKTEGWAFYEYTSLNKTEAGTELELISPDSNAVLRKGDYFFVNPENGTIMDWTNDSHPTLFYARKGFENRTLVRTKDEGYVEGQFRNTQR